MYYGVYNSKIDSKNRLFIPSSFRKDISSVVLTKIDGDTLIVSNVTNFSPEGLLAGSNLPQSELELYLKYIKLNSSVVDVDSQGRIVIPKNLYLSLSFNGECVIVGNGNNFQILNKEKFYEEQEEMERAVSEFLSTKEGEEFRKNLRLNKGGSF